MNMEKVVEAIFLSLVKSQQSTALKNHKAGYGRNNFDSLIIIRQSRSSAG